MIESQQKIVKLLLWIVALLLFATTYRANASVLTASQSFSDGFTYRHTQSFMGGQGPMHVELVGINHSLNQKTTLVNHFQTLGLSQRVKNPAHLAWQGAMNSCKALGYSSSDCRNGKTFYKGSWSGKKPSKRITNPLYKAWNDIITECKKWIKGGKVCKAGIPFWKEVNDGNKKVPCFPQVWKKCRKKKLVKVTIGVEPPKTIPNLARIAYDACVNASSLISGGKRCSVSVSSQLAGLGSAPSEYITASANSKIGANVKAEISGTVGLNAGITYQPGQVGVDIDASVDVQLNQLSDKVDGLVKNQLSVQANGISSTAQMSDNSVDFDLSANLNFNVGMSGEVCLLVNCNKFDLAGSGLNVGDFNLLDVSFNPNLSLGLFGLQQPFELGDKPGDQLLTMDVHFPGSGGKAVTFNGKGAGDASPALSASIYNPFKGLKEGLLDNGHHISNIADTTVGITRVGEQLFGSPGLLRREVGIPKVKGVKGRYIALDVRGGARAQLETSIGVRDNFKVKIDFDQEVFKRDGNKFVSLGTSVVTGVNDNLEVFSKSGNVLDIVNRTYLWDAHLNVDVNALIKPVIEVTSGCFKFTEIPSLTNTSVESKLHDKLKQEKCLVKNQEIKGLGVTSYDVFSSTKKILGVDLISFNNSALRGSTTTTGSNAIPEAPLLFHFGAAVLLLLRIRMKVAEG